MTQKPKRPRASATASCFPDELVEFCILPHLPAKSLMRFKCVCKTWNRLISSPHPRLVYLQSLHAASCLLADDGDTSRLYVSRDPTLVGIRNFGEHIKRFISNIASYSVVASCNGILCCTSKTIYLEYIVIGNPSLKKWKCLPSKPFRRLNLCRTGLLYGLTVDVCESSVRYEIVLLNNMKNVYEAHIFSSTTDSWRVRKMDIKLPVGTKIQSVSVYAKGYIYWKFETDFSVLWFNMEKEICGLRTLPVGADQPGLGNIGECGGHLSYAFIKDGVIQMWSLIHLKWSKRHSIALHNIVGGKLKHILIPPGTRYNMLLRTARQPYQVIQVSMMPFQGGDCLSVSMDSGVMYCLDIFACVSNKQAIPNSQWYHYIPYKNTIVCLP